MVSDTGKSLINKSTLRGIYAMKNTSKHSQQDLNSDLAQDVKLMKNLLILLGNRLGVEKQDIAKSMGIS